MSGSWRKTLSAGRPGPIKTILMGDRTVDTALFHPPLESPTSKKARGADSGSTQCRKQRQNPKTRKRMTNFTRERGMVIFAS